MPSGSWVTMISNKKYVLAVAGRSLEEILLQDPRAENSHNYCTSHRCSEVPGQQPSPEQGKGQFTAFCSGTNFYIQRR